ncbi:MAG: DUF7475 family protein [Halobacteriota archaeon]
METGTSDDGSSKVSLPDHRLGYLAILMALVTAAIHLILSPVAIEMNQMMGVLFALNGLGFLFGIGVYLTVFWRRSFYLVGAAYALTTILALFAFQGWGVEAFYMEGNLNPMAVVSKAVEAVLVVCCVLLYRFDDI